MISAKVIADSKNEFGNRITTMVVTMPRIILAEFNTHRMFSRNSASSRAIPFKKMVKMVEENPFIPIAWQKDHKGMQGNEYFTKEDDIQGARDEWLESRDGQIANAKQLNKQGVTKQLCNRLLEPFMWHTVIVTATEWENFFALRCPQYEYYDMLTGNQQFFKSKKDWLQYYDNKPLPKAKHISKIPENDVEWLQINKGQAEIHMMALAEAMWDAYNESIPKELKAGEWHIPFGDNIDVNQVNNIWRNKQGLITSLETANYPALQEGISKEEYEEYAVKIATARCARVSYTVVGEEGKPDSYEADIKLHDRLAASGHWSPFEHCAKVMNKDEYNSRLSISNNGQHGWSGNFRGFVQYRKMFANENIT